MVQLEIQPHELVIHFPGAMALLAWRSRLAIPFSHIVNVRMQPPEARFEDTIVEGNRGYGTYVPGKIAVGSVYTRDGDAFYAVRHPGRAIAIDLRSEPFSPVVVEVETEEPEIWIRRLVRAMRHEAGVLPGVSLRH
jgi:hypothetical protein